MPGRSESLAERLDKIALGLQASYILNFGLQLIGSIFAFLGNVLKLWAGKLGVRITHLLTASVYAIDGFCHLPRVALKIILRSCSSIICVLAGYSQVAGKRDDLQNCARRAEGFE